MSYLVSHCASALGSMDESPLVAVAAGDANIMRQCPLVGILFFTVNCKPCRDRA